MKNDLTYLVNKRIITEEGGIRIEEYIKRLTSNNLPAIYNLRHLRKIFQIKKTEQSLFFGAEKFKNYRSFYIPKKTNGYRKIEAPNEHLLQIQRWINKNILNKLNVSDSAKGFKKKSSIVDNAKIHINKELVINLDIKDFFKSIKYGQIFRLFIYLGYTREVSHLLTKLCTNSNNVLPQGAPTSPILSNILMLKLDKRLSKLAIKFNANYTRYADDITFSGDRNISKMIPIILKIIEDEKLKVNFSKFRLQYYYQTQMVTGLIVNKKLGIPKRLKKELNNAIYYCKKFGVDKHMANINCKRTFYKEHLYGIAYFIKMIDQNLGNKYISELDTIEWAY